MWSRFIGVSLTCVCALVLTAAGAATPGATPSPVTVVSLTFDDGYASDYTAAKPILAAHGVHGTFYIPTNLVGSSGYMTWSDIGALAADGNEIGGHTLDHEDLTTVSLSEARRQVCAGRNVLLGRGFPVTDFAYPYGSFNAGIESIVQLCGYNSARTVLWNGVPCWRPCTESIPPRDPYATTVVAFGGDQTLTDIENTVMIAETYGGWAPIVIHRVCDGCSKGAMRPADLSALLDWLAPRVARGTVVETVADVIGGPVKPPVSPDGSATSPGPPGTPTGVAGDASVTVSWSAPVSDGGSAISVYKVTATPGGGTCATTGALSCTVSGLTNGTTYTFAVTATNSVGTGPASLASAPVTPKPSSVLVSDSFGRTVMAGWGAADVGGVWSVSSTGRTKVADSEGVVYGWTGGNQDEEAWNSTVARNMEVLAEVRLSASNPTGAAYAPRVVVRAQSDPRNGYWARLTHTTGGGLNWALARVDNTGGTGTAVLGSGSLLTSGAAGTTWWIRLRANGTTIQARFWKAGTTEPATWQTTASDGYWTEGRPAAGVYTWPGITSPFPVTGFATFTATDLSSAASTPTAASPTAVPPVP